MNSGFLDVLMLMATYTLWICLPLLPAILIYRLFPDTMVALSGPFKGLTISASGAFAAYFITLIASIFLMKSIVTTIRNPPNLQWTITGKVNFFDANGKQIPPQDANVFLSPNVGHVDSGMLTTRVQLDNERLSVIRIEQGGASQTIDLGDKKNWQSVADWDSYRVNITTPIELREPGVTQMGETPDSQ